MENKKMLDLGCGAKKRKGAVGVDVIPNQGVDIVYDLNLSPYPFSDNEFDDILLDNSLEHLDSVVKTLEEVWRISKPGARVTIKVPYFRSHFAIDPTHKHYFVSHSLHYFDPKHDFHKRYKYSTKALFNVEKVVFDEEYSCSIINKPVLFLTKWFANRHPMWYEEFLAHLFPLHCLTFYLTVIKK